MPGGVGVQSGVVEEEVDGGLVPPQADLTVGQDRRDRRLVVGDAVRQGVERDPALVGRREQVDVEVAGSPRVQRPVGERYRAPERVLDSGGVEALVDCEKPIGELHEPPDGVGSRGKPRVRR